MTMYYEQVITPATGGFGEWQTSSEVPGEDDLHADCTDILDACKDAYPQGEVYQLGKDALPEGVEDITGRIHNEPDRVFALIVDGEVTYFGISEY